MKKIIFTLVLLLGFVIGNSNAVIGDTESHILNEGSSYSNVLICVSSTAERFHAYECWGLAQCKHDVVSVSVSTAQSKGYTPCKICYKQ